MRHLHRQPLPPETQADLDRRQSEVDRRLKAGALDPTKTWEAARRTRHLVQASAVLKTMAGKRQRCMYCCDSHGTDIDHFWPKALKKYPEKMFQWSNLLLSCTECGRFKGDQFPLADGAPLLVDPTQEDPWLCLDFDPATGNLTATFDVGSNCISPKGIETVTVLQLDRREALATSYKRTFHRLAAVVERHLQTGTPTEQHLPTELAELDDHGLLPWCLLGSGRNDPPFRTLRERAPETWAACVRRQEWANAASQP